MSTVILLSQDALHSSHSFVLVRKWMIRFIFSIHFIFGIKPLVRLDNEFAVLAKSGKKGKR